MDSAFPVSPLLSAPPGDPPPLSPHDLDVLFCVFEERMDKAGLHVKREKSFPEYVSGDSYSVVSVRYIVKPTDSLFVQAMAALAGIEGIVTELARTVLTKPEYVNRTRGFLELTRELNEADDMVYIVVKWHTRKSWFGSILEDMVPIPGKHDTKEVTP